MIQHFLIVLVWLTIAFTASVASVQAALVVQFEATPLFNEAKIVPGDSVARTVVVENTGSETETVQVHVENFIYGDLASALGITITSGATQYLDTTLDQFFATTPIDLGQLAPGGEQTYTFRVSFPASSGNPLMLKETKFDLSIGFLGGEQISDTPRTRTSSGGGGGVRTLRLFNELVAEVYPESRTAYVTWESNLPATSYLVCSEGKDIALTTAAPLFGYSFAIFEVDNLVLDHGLVVSGDAGKSYECRPAGRRNLTDPFTVGQPVTFAFPGGLVAGVATSSFPLLAGENVGGDSVEAPQGMVLGDQISLWPKGGVNLGFGVIDVRIPLLAVLFILLFILVRRFKRT